jgi:hypothetical protein
MGNPPGVPQTGLLSSDMTDGLKAIKPIADAVQANMEQEAKDAHLDVVDSKFLGMAGKFLAYGLYLVISLFTMIGIPLATPLIKLFLGALTKVRNDTLPEQQIISNAVLGEFLGVDVPTATAVTPGKITSPAAVSAALGNSLYTQLLKEFSPNTPLQAGDGERAAKMFSGFAVNFATQNAILSTLVDAASLHFLGEFRELGVGVARNLGLGRLQRQALGTLLQNVMQKPYNRELQARYRPDRLSVVEYIHARNRGDITDAQLTTALQETGYRDEDIKAVINEYTDKLSTAELLTLVRYGKLNEDAAIAILQSQGLDASTAAMRLQAAQLAIENDNVKAYVDALNQAVRARTIDSDTWSTLMNQVPWTDDEKQWQKLANGAYLDFYQKMLTWTQVITAYENGIVDVDYVEAWLVSKGYSQDDILNMELLLAVKFDAFATAAAKKTAAAKTPTPPKPPAVP